MQADAYDGFNPLYLAERKPAPIREAACWAHARRKFYVLADIEENARRKAAGKKEIPLSPIAVEVVRRMDALFAIERAINGKRPQERAAVRKISSRPLVDDLQLYMREQAAKLSRGHDLVKAIQYMLKRWPAFTLFLDDGRVCITNNAAERGLRGIALGRKSWLFCGSDDGASYCSSRHVLISQRDFSDDRQTAGVAISERWLRGEQSRAPSRRGGLSRARPCMAGSRIALVRRSNDARLTY